MLTGLGRKKEVVHRAKKQRLAAAASEEDITHAAEVARLMGCIEVGPCQHSLGMIGSEHLMLTLLGPKQEFVHRAKKHRLAAAASEEDITHAEVARLMGCIQVSLGHPLHMFSVFSVVRSRLHRLEAERKRLAAAASEEDIAHAAEEQVTHAAEVARLIGCIEVSPRLGMLGTEYLKLVALG